MSRRGHHCQKFKCKDKCKIESILECFELKSLVMCQKPFYRTLNELKRVHHLVLELQHTIFVFEQTAIKHLT